MAQRLGGHMDWIGLASEKFALRCLRIGVEPAFMNLHWDTRGVIGTWISGCIYQATL
jgi:hypothetical protein